MPTRVRIYIATIVGLAISIVIALAALGPPATLRSAATAAFLCAIGWLASQICYELDQKGANGTVGFLLFPAAAFAVANWTVPLLVGVTVLGLEVRRRAAPPKILFNTAAQAAANALSILAFHAVGGRAWLNEGQIGIGSVAALLVTGSMACSAATTGVIALSQSQPFWKTWRAVSGRTALDDILVSPVVGVIAYSAAAWGVVPTLAVCSTLLWINRLYQTNQALQRVSHEMLELMVSAIEARDPYTSGHSRRVSRMAIEIARAINLPDRAVARIGVAGLLHDVGKIHEKYAPILSKPDRLSKDEWMLMKEHPIDGERLVANVSQLHDVLPAVRNHHERWDGAGYPDGLKGEGIPLMARVLAIADTIDAMTSDRSYRRGLTVDEVRAEVERCAGTQFDPKMVEQLLAGPHWNALFYPEATERQTRFGLRVVRGGAAVSA
jgi:HD-GYP domain-containing protein (c-di-GMP phosphodiesterase class II)